MPAGRPPSKLDKAVGFKTDAETLARLNEVVDGLRMSRSDTLNILLRVALSDEHVRRIVRLISAKKVSS